ncbi:unnamed protein product [Polarella glacialis]|uniref:Uncharacterized protein n=2 Tax=Polarella glacialis TaxID=89957 RepID=A0A813I0K5_POLGL|nr:unnamed protein product [Polarella glacialis]
MSSATAGMPQSASTAPKAKPLGTAANRSATPGAGGRVPPKVPDQVRELQERAAAAAKPTCDAKDSKAAAKGAAVVAELKSKELRPARRCCSFWRLVIPSALTCVLIAYVLPKENQDSVTEFLRRVLPQTLQDTASSVQHTVSTQAQQVRIQAQQVRLPSFDGDHHQMMENLRSNLADAKAEIMKLVDRTLSGQGNPAPAETVVKESKVEQVKAAQEPEKEQEKQPRKVENLKPAKVKQDPAGKRAKLEQKLEKIKEHLIKAVEAEDFVRAKLLKEKEAKLMIHLGLGDPVEVKA